MAPWFRRQQHGSFVRGRYVPSPEAHAAHDTHVMSLVQEKHCKRGVHAWISSATGTTCTLCSTTRSSIKTPVATEIYGQLSAVIPDLHTRVNCPRCPDRGSLGLIIIHLNDYHRTSREEIADWVETLDLDLTLSA